MLAIALVAVGAAACGEPESTTRTTQFWCPAPPTDVAIIDNHGLVERTCRPEPDLAATERRIEVVRTDARTISLYWTGGCDMSGIAVTPIDGGHRFSVYPAGRSCELTLGIDRSVAIRTTAPLGKVEYQLVSSG